MNHKIYQEKDLPWAELEGLGLANKGKLLISQGDKDALLSGRRTSLQLLKNIKDDNLHIGEIDVKLSLKTDETGKLQLQAHPIHNYPRTPAGLDELEAVQLISGEKRTIYKKLKQGEDLYHEAIFEFDSDTGEFVKTDPLKISIPEKVNNEELTEAQKERYRQGQEVELKEGTTFRYTGVDANPVRADKLLLIASILIDGGLTYLAYHGLKALAGNRNNDPKAAIKSEGYNKAYAEMEQHKPQNQKVNPDTDHDRSYTRSGRAR